MQTLRYLNGISTSSVTFTDNRGTNVIFDRAAGKSYSFTETSLSFNLLVGANIVDIINPSSANVRYKINIGTAQASLNFGTLPAGVTVSQAGTIYTVYGIDSISDWEAVKQPTVTIDPAFAGSFSYEAAVVYNTDTAADIEFEWTVGVYLPTAQLTANASISITPSYIRGGISNMVGVFNWRDFIYEFIYRGNFSLIASSRVDYNSYVATLSTVSTLNCIATAYVSFNQRTDIQRSSNLFGKALDIASGSPYTNKDIMMVNNDATGGIAVDYILPDGTTFPDPDFDPEGDSLTVYAPTWISFTQGTGTTNHWFGAVTNEGTIIQRHRNTTDDWEDFDTLTGVNRIELTDTYALTTKGTSINLYTYNTSTTQLDLEWSKTMSSSFIALSNNYAVTASGTTVNVYNPSTGNSITSFSLSNTIRSIDLYNNELLVGTTTETKLFDIDTSTTLLTISTAAGIGNKTVSVTNLWVAIGDKDVGTTVKGTVKIYDKSDGTLHETLNNPNIDTTSGDDYFGHNVVITEDYCVISAHFEELVPNGQTNYGAVYVYT